MAFILVFKKELNFLLPLCNFLTVGQTRFVLIWRETTMTTMLSLFMMSLLIFCVTAENQIEQQASLTSKVRLILLRYVRVATINSSLCNYKFNAIISSITYHVKCIPV